MTITEKVAYLKGLMEGLKLDTETSEGKVLAALVDVVNDIALELEDVYDEIDTLKDYADELDHDLGDVESFLLEEDDCDCDCDCCEDEDCDCCDDDMYCDGDCDCCEDEDCDCCGELYSIECPNCGDEIFFDESIDTDCLICPNCGKRFSVQITEKNGDDEITEINIEEQDGE